jgi:hypothetical protein
MLEKGKELATKDADEEPFFDDTKFAVDQLKGAFRKLEDVGAAFNIKAHHEVDKDPSMKGLAFRIHGLAERLEKLPVVKRACHHFVFDDGGDDSDGSHCTTTALMVATTVMTALMATTVAMTVGLPLPISNNVCVCVSFCVLVRLLDMNCLVCLSIMNCLVN